MTVVRFAIIVLMSLSLGVFLVLPLEDLPETAFDESETPPFESTALFSGRLLQALVRTPELKLKLDAQFRLDSLARPQGQVERRPSLAHPISDSITILDHSLRC